MLKLPAPATPPYIAPVRAISFIAVLLPHFDELSGRFTPDFILLDAQKKPIMPERAFLPQQPPAPTAAQLAAFGIALQTQTVSRAALPIAEALFGLQGLTVIAPLAGSTLSLEQEALAAAKAARAAKMAAAKAAPATPVKA
jgi:hypothetical protein